MSTTVAVRLVAPAETVEMARAHGRDCGMTLGEVLWQAAAEEHNAHQRGARLRPPRQSGEGMSVEWVPGVHEHADERVRELARSDGSWLSETWCAVLVAWVDRRTCMAARAA